MLLSSEKKHKIQKKILAYKWTRKKQEYNCLDWALFKPQKNFVLLMQPEAVRIAAGPDPLLAISFYARHTRTLELW